MGRVSHAMIVLQRMLSESHIPYVLFAVHQVRLFIVYILLILGIVWSKSYLYGHLFGKDEEKDDEDQINATENSENAQEIEILTAEANDLNMLKASIGTAEAAKLIFEKVGFFNERFSRKT